MGFKPGRVQTKQFADHSGGRSASRRLAIAESQLRERRALVARAKRLEGGIEKESAHPRAIELAPEEFFWSCVDELAPFGSDEGATSLEEFVTWRRKNMGKPLRDCLVWVIEAVSEMPHGGYNRTLGNVVAPPLCLMYT